MRNSLAGGSTTLLGYSSTPIKVHQRYGGTILYGSGSWSLSCVFYVSGWRDATKDMLFLSKFFLLITPFEGTFTSVFTDKSKNGVKSRNRGFSYFILGLLMEGSGSIQRGGPKTFGMDPTDPDPQHWGELWIHASWILGICNWYCKQIP